MSKIIAYILYGLIWIISLLPLPILYLISDIVWLIMFICPPLRYRKKIVRKNLALSFPDKDKKWIKRTERRFYYQFACQVMEALKTVSASKKWILRHMEFVGMDHLVQETLKGRSGIGYLGHVGNWEWIPAMNLFYADVNDFVGGQVYHRLENPVMELIMYKLRNKFGTVSIPMEQVMRKFISYRSEGKRFFIGMIADQVPMWWNIHYWTQFMNRETPVFTGAERLARKMDLEVWYMHITRKRRGYYRCEMQLVFEHTADLPEYAVTEKYMRLLEDNIRECPELWLWTHNRWKRTRQGYEEWLAKHPTADRQKKS